ncbi:MAG: NCS2 family permease [Planctomycetota bacterium]
MPTRNPLFCRGDLDGFCGLFVDNLVQFLSIALLFGPACGIAAGSDGAAALDALLRDRVFPAVAVSLLVGNLFYAWQAHRLSRREGRDDVTALPYGVNTPSLLVFLFFVIGPAYRAAIDAGVGEAAALERAWAVGLVACLGSGVIELLGSAVAGTIRRHTPRAALLSTLAGIAIGFISMTFALQIFQRPLVAMPATAVVLLTYFSGYRLPLGLPGGLAAVLLGTAVAWGVVTPLSASAPWLTGPPMSGDAVNTAAASFGVVTPTLALAPLGETLGDPSAWFGLLSVIVPMGLFNVVGSLQNIESAEAAGDRFETAPSMAANGLGTIAAACCGSCFPTTIYIGHPGWKAMGARSGYSTLNGLVVTALCLTGSVGVIAAVVPLESSVAIVLWIGLIIAAQAFHSFERPEGDGGLDGDAVNRRHGPAVAVGLFPAIAAFGFTVTQGAFITAYFGSGMTGPTLQDLVGDVPTLSGSAAVNGFLLHGMITLERGYIFTCLILSTVSVLLIEGRFKTAACWSLAAAMLTALGLMHAYQLSGNNVDYLFAFVAPAEDATPFRACDIAIGYLAFAGIFAAAAFAGPKRPDRPE